ncbi:hypothetical protein OH491_18640 [Termitidicoccus mucosus]|uniref:Uncharacterized protein n=1 Tax=Termitidicoccus mucosus TaxID=1184151 RepID=A0A178ILZ6_9BACT|nr:hypothetical protein AW736_09980 [Opitutaceae bacterium TSB47]
MENRHDTGNMRAGPATPGTTAFAVLRMELVRTSLYDQVWARATLRAACQDVLAQPVGSVREQRQMDSIAARQEKFLEQLGWELETRAYRLGAVLRARVYSSRAPVKFIRMMQPRDRIVCLALLCVLEPMLLQAIASGTEIPCQSAERMQEGLEAIRAAFESGRHVVLEGDYDTRNWLWDLHRLVARQLKDAAVLDLIKRLLRAPLIEALRWEE